MRHSHLVSGEAGIWLQSDTLPLDDCVLSKYLWKDDGVAKGRREDQLTGREKKIKGKKDQLSVENNLESDVMQKKKKNLQNSTPESRGVVTAAWKKLEAHLCKGCFPRIKTQHLETG